jgi:hypothetical protein
MCLSGVLVPHHLTRDRPRRAGFWVRVECGSDVAGSALCWVVLAAGAASPTFDSALQLREHRRNATSRCPLTKRLLRVICREITAEREGRPDAVSAGNREFSRL